MAFMELVESCEELGEINMLNRHLPGGGEQGIAKKKIK